MDPTVSNQPSASVQSVEAALRVLEALGQAGGTLRISELAERLNLTRPRVCRHLATLEAMGFARKLGRQGYTSGSRLVQMAHHVLRERTFSELAQPALEALRDELDETVTLAVPAEEGAVVLYCLESDKPTSIRVRQGTVLRYPYSPAGRLCVALATAQTQPAFSQDAGEAALRAQACLQTHGVDFEIDTQFTGLGGVAAPVVVEGRFLGVVSLVVPSRQLMPTPPARMIAAVRRAVQTIEAAALA